MQEKMVFDQTLEGLFVRGLEGRVTPTLRLSLKEVGVDLDRKLLPAYPFETWCSGVRVAARELSEVRILERASNHLELWMNEAGPTRYLVQGAILAGMRGCRVSEAQVRVLSFTAEDVTFEVAWRGAP